jgi:purine-nucleoside phosphorylase
MRTLPEFFQLEKYNVSAVDVTRMVFHSDPEAIQPDVILLPYWQADLFSLWADKITTIRPQVFYEIEYKGRKFSLVRSGIGAPLAGDMTLALGCTPCKRLLFAGSVGGLQPDIRIGDLMIPEFSYSGDGYCRYLEPEAPEKDCMLEKVRPTQSLSSTLLHLAVERAEEAGVKVHQGPVFSIDTILSQFRLLDYFSGELGCVGIEMETAAVFKAARVVGIQCAALLSVSDVPVNKQTLLEGRSLQEQDHRKEIRSKVLTGILLDCFLPATRD